MNCMGSLPRFEGRPFRWKRIYPRAAARTLVPDFARFLRIGLGSASELECELLIAHDLGFMNDGRYDDLANQVVGTKRMLTGFIHYLNGSRTGTKV